MSKIISLPRPIVPKFTIMSAVRHLNGVVVPMVSVAPVNTRTAPLANAGSAQSVRPCTLWRRYVTARK